MTSFLPFFNPATGEWIEYLALTDDADGGMVRFDWRSVPGGVITEHIHPGQEERFTIIAGEAHFTLDGEALVGRPSCTRPSPASSPTGAPPRAARPRTRSSSGPPSGTSATRAG